MDSLKDRILVVESRITAIREMVAAHRTRDAQELFRDLKTHLDSEYRKMRGSKNEALLSPLERDFYQPFIADAWANSGISGVRWDSDPSTWKDALWSVSDYVVHWTGSLKRASTEA